MPSYTLAEDTYTTVGTGRYGSFNYTITQYPSHGVLTPIYNPPSGATGSGGTVFRYAPYADYNGPDTFSIQDNNGGGTFYMTVTPEPDAPVAADDQFTVGGYRIAASELLRNDIDVDGETLTVTSVGSAVNGSVELRDGFVTFTPTDPAYRGDAVFSYTASDPTGRADTATVTLRGASSAPPVLSISGPGSLAEGSSGLTPFTFTVTRSGDLSSTSDASFFVWHETTSRDDLSTSEGAVRFNAGEASKQITVYVTGDAAVEPDETFHVQLYDPHGASLGTVEAGATIVNDDGASQPPPSGGQVYNSPGPGSTIVAGSGDDTINASQGSDVLTGGGGRDTFHWDREPWSPATITDFVVGTDRLDFSSLFATAHYTGSDPVADHYITLLAQGSDTLVLFDHDGTGPSPQWSNYVLKLSGVATSGLSWAQLSGSQPTAVSQISIPEWAQAGEFPYQFTLTRTGSTANAATVTWTVSSEGHQTIASQGFEPVDVNDFDGGAYPSGTVTFAPGQASAIISVPVRQDTNPEPEEAFIVTLSAPSGAVLGNARAVGGIYDNDRTSDQVITSHQYGDTLTGGAGNDTLNAGQGPDRLTGGGGGDHFVYQNLPWNAGHVTDFQTGVDKLDLRPLFAAAGYSGTDPIGDHRLEFRSDGAGNTQVYFDRDAPNSGDWPFLITTLDHVQPSQIGAGDWLFR